MNLLLDTHVALWAITDSPRLPKKALELIKSPKSSVWISAATIWEIAIKHSLGRGDMPVSSQDALRYFRDSGYGFLPVEPEHAAAVEDLPAHHADPFDRILVAQALVEPMRLITHDAMVARYSNTIIEI
ncbi:MAG: type II toxin-antitoxin system VapC family toxin [Rhodocyclaceae bacterium]|nr:type II toxin-antitoxin system VapC family toxin [Rhodocyclaceae bacterium]